MLIYWLFFISFAYFAFKEKCSNNINLDEVIFRRFTISWFFCWFSLTIVIGFRHEVGGDWVGYIKAIEDAPEYFLLHGDIAYNLLNWFGSNYFGGIYLVNSVCAGLFSWGLLVFCRLQNRPWLSLNVALPFLIIVVGMGYTRQATALGICMWGIFYLLNGSYIRYIFLIFSAFLFHRSSLIMILPLFFISNGFCNISCKLASSCLLIFSLYLLNNIGVFEALSIGYFESEYNSSAASLRVAMNALPASIFLAFKSKFNLNDHQNSFWSVMSIFALLFVLLLFISPSSVVIDRLSLYFIPIQLFVFSYLPEVFGGSRLKIFFSRHYWILIIVLYSALVQFVWLFFADHSQFWVPYKFYLWGILWY